ncbi:uncharacterized protein PHALS_08182 [Plasmopara halstedii]|uniref:Uncharacterized protein n=1 Tax=Plasmopara halstedii TaxID=4781 RepID=A0A0P1ACJ8_PLAHL|nr:uncharacterized protein PHALS_08182 [Plasmopara halstedii]CEG38087.1 hypothetical protein PHALS_08182 [Plasmopara halstedii]|eukprot:XP_024574456.1 hypothetical protein PHALS_08182 [Plasmopara halstedii]
MLKVCYQVRKTPSPSPSPKTIRSHANFFEGKTLFTLYFILARAARCAPDSQSIEYCDWDPCPSGRDVALKLCTHLNQTATASSTVALGELPGFAGGR